jgi:hypothetical protein
VPPPWWKQFLKSIGPKDLDINPTHVRNSKNKGFEWLLILGNCAIYITWWGEGSSMYKTCVHTPNACETIIISSHNTITRKPYCFCHKFSFTITTKPYCFCQESNKLVFLFGIFQSLAFLWKCPDFQNCKRNAIVWTDWASLIIITPISLIPTLIGIVKIPQTQDGFF